MHDIEPYYNWREHYVVEEDRYSPFFRKKYDEFYYTNKVYNYYIHPQWDDFGSETLYLKILFADYEAGFAVIELLGEWNDCLYNDVMFLKRNILDKLMYRGIYKYLLIGENVMNFHGGDDDYYEEWYENVTENDGWILFMNLYQHVYEEMCRCRLNRYAEFFPFLMDYEWRKQNPQNLFMILDTLMSKNKFIETE